ncbi:MAG: hypothetical protein KAT48_12155 [Bacteroidales bacterium]|nr:hypothetical protein [Bacteroidales bacterium]
MEKIREENPYKYLLIVGKFLPNIIPKQKDLMAENDPITGITLELATKNLDIEN